MSILRPVPMEKVGVVALKSDRESVLSVLYDLGVVQVEPVRKEALRILSPEATPEQARRVADELLRIRGVKSALPPSGAPAPRAFANLDELLNEAERIPMAEQVAALKREEDRLLTERKGLVDHRDLLSRFSFYTGPLEYLRLQHVLGFFGEADGETYPALRNDIRSAADVLFVEAPADDKVRFVVAVNVDKAEAVSRLAQQKGVLLSAAPALTGTIVEVLPQLDQRLERVDRRLAEIREKLARMAAEWYVPVAALEEALTIANRTFEIFGRFGAGQDFFVLEGWIPSRARSEVEERLRAVTRDQVLVYSVPTTEEPPTLLDNPKGIRRFEFFIRFYALPQATEWDPTWIFAFAFPLFFGFMLSDIGYGVTILLISIWMIAGFPGARYLPRAGKKFVKLIMSPRAMQSLAWTLIPGSILAIVLGWFSNEVFGPLPSNYSLPGPHYDPFRNNVGDLFLIAGFIGLAMVTLGFVLGALKEWYHRHPRGTVQKVGGIFLAWGVSFLGVQLVSRLTFQRLLGVPYPIGSTVPPAEWIEIAFIVAGLGLMVAAEGAQGLLGLTEVLSHVLSYLRLVGILVSAIVIADLINSVARGLLGQGLVDALLAGVLIVGGQAFNVIVGVFEPGIQGARLIFVEFFSKFYTGNGRPFQPFGTRREHTLPAPLPKP